jgi:hypothetical protein
MISLWVYERPAEGERFHFNLTPYIGNSWSRTTRAVGGYWQGKTRIVGMNRAQMLHIFSSFLGRRVREKTYSITTWEGELFEMDLIIDGVVYRRSLHPEKWHNRVKVAYTDYATKAATATTWAETTASSDIWGECEYIDTVDDSYSSTLAEGLRSRRLAEYAYPRSRGAGGLIFGRSRRAADRLTLKCSGYVYSMNRRYRESDTAATDAICPSACGTQ